MTPASGLRSCTLHICNIWQSLFNSGTQGRNFMIRCSFIKRKNCQQGIEKRILRRASSGERRNTRDWQHFLCVKTSCFGRPGHDVTTSQVTSIALPFLSGSQSRRWNATQHLPMTIWEHPLGEHVQKKICENWNLHIPTQPSDIKASIENQINFPSNLPDLYQTREVGRQGICKSRYAWSLLEVCWKFACIYSDWRLQKVLLSSTCIQFFWTCS